MKCINLFLSVAVIMLLSSCSQEEFATENAQSVDDMSEMFAIELIDGLSVEETVDFFYSLETEEQEIYKISNVENPAELETRGYSWSSWRYYTTYSCTCSSRTRLKRLNMKKRYLYKDGNYVYTQRKLVSSTCTNYTC